MTIDTFLDSLLSELAAVRTYVYRMSGYLDY